MRNTLLGNRKATTKASPWLSERSCGGFLFVSPQTSIAFDWTARNGPEGGYVAQIAGDYTDSNIAYLASYAGGIFKTTDGGTSWTDLHAYFGSSKIVLDRTNHTTVYVVGGNIVKSTVQAPIGRFSIRQTPLRGWCQNFGHRSQ